MLVDRAGLQLEECPNRLQRLISALEKKKENIAFGDTKRDLEGEFIKPIDKGDPDTRSVRLETSL